MRVSFLAKLENSSLTPLQSLYTCCISISKNINKILIIWNALNFTSVWQLFSLFNALGMQTLHFLVYVTEQIQYVAFVVDIAPYRNCVHKVWSFSFDEYMWSVALFLLYSTWCTTSCNSLPKIITKVYPYNNNKNTKTHSYHYYYCCCCYYN